MSSCLSLAHFLFKSSFWKKKGNRGILGFRVLRIQESRVRDYVGLPGNEKPFKNAAKARGGYIGSSSRLGKPQIAMNQGSTVTIEGIR